MTFEEIEEFLKKHNSRDVIITGGEPTSDKNIEKVIDLINRLLSINIKVYIETNGLVDVRSLYPVFKKVWISTSPKLIYYSLYHKQQDKMIKEADEVRIVVDPKLPYEKQLDHCLFYYNTIKAKYYYLSPCEVDGQFTKLDIVAKLYQELNKLTNNNFRISLQLHKIMNVQ